MKILFELSHPKHYYQFRYLILNLINRKVDIRILAREKDVLLKILQEENIPFIIPGKHGKGIVSKFLILPKFLFNYAMIVRKFKPDLILSKASPYAIFMKPLFKGRIVITPDSEVVKLTRKLVAPFSDIVITPSGYELDYGSKHKRIDGFFEEAYLSPDVYTPDRNILPKYKINTDNPYFVLRFVSWEANHDIGHFGFNDNQKIFLVDLLSKFGKVYISAERKNIPEVLNPYILKIEAKDIHHVISYASAYIGDSQTMATESALLGTPSFRYNSFVGENDMSNFIILEEKFGLLKNFRDFDSLIINLKELLDNKESKNIWLQKRKDYFLGKPDLNKQILSILNIG